MTSILVSDINQPATLVDTTDDHAGEGNTRITISHSSINYKDAMAMRGDKGVVRTTPLVAGIDAVGKLDDDTLVTVNGGGLGEFRHGSYTTVTNVDDSLVVKVPERFSAFEAAAIGTAGFTAALSVREIIEGVEPSDGPILVTGSTGGVGSIAISLLHGLGYEVHALTGRGEEYGSYLRELGASEIVDRADYAEVGKPLQRASWGGVVDTVGSATLVNAIAQTKWGGTITACGLAHGADLPGTVLPFILRGTRLIGINSVDAPHQLRVEAWDLLDKHLDTSVLKSFTDTVSLDQAIDAGAELYASKRRGRIVVEI